MEMLLSKLGVKNTKSRDPPRFTSVGLTCLPVGKPTHRNANRTDTKPISMKDFNPSTFNALKRSARGMWETVASLSFLLLS